MMRYLLPFLILSPVFAAAGNEFRYSCNSYATCTTNGECIRAIDFGSFVLVQPDTAHSWVERANGAKIHVGMFDDIPAAKSQLPKADPNKRLDLISVPNYEIADAVGYNVYELSYSSEATFSEHYTKIICGTEWGMN